jgi:threonine dehydrogenase-like Zn-dependent dehydrogenase
MSTQIETEVLPCPHVESKKDMTRKMKAVEWRGNTSVAVVERPRPLITDPQDAIVRVTTTTICGSDLHLYHSEFQGLQSGDILGHECMGIVESVGGEVKNVKVGDRVVVSFDIACGKCFYCQKELYSSCETTNPTKDLIAVYGHKTGGYFGYSHLTGGYDGCQAEVVRVPFADMNTLKVPDSLPDEKVFMLSDVISTAYHATELGQVSEGDIVAIWGCGPIGLMAAKWCFYRKAKRVICIDAVDYRLQIAKSIGAETINFAEKEVVKTLQEMLTYGPDVCIDAVGFRFPKSLLHKLERGLRLETDSPEVLTEAIKACRKGGRISIIGDYYATANQFPIGAFMEKGLSAGAGQSPTQKYWKKLLGIIEKGDFDPTFIITHKLPIDKAAEAYKMFDEKKDNIIKVMLKPTSTSTQ